MKIIDIDFKEDGKKYKCGNTIFKVKEGDLVDIENNTYLKDLCIPISKLLEKDFEEIKEAKNPCAKVDYRDKYYTIEGDGRVSFYEECGHNYDKKMFNAANYFNNKNYAEYIAFKETLMRKMDRFAWEHNAKAVSWDKNAAGWDRNVAKYYIVFDHSCDEKLVVYNCFAVQSNNIYFISREIAEKALEEFKDDLIKLYTWEFDF